MIQRLRPMRKTTALPIVSIFALIMLLPACGLLGGDRAQMDMTDFYNLYLPLVRDVAHPDSVVASDDDRLSDVRLRWSVNHNRRYGSADYSPGNYTSFATLWSRDLAERTLQREITGDLSPDLQERLHAEQNDRIEESVVFDVHLFVPATRGYDLSDTNIRGAGATVILETTDGTSYRPSHIESGIVERYQMGPSDVPAFYRLNRVYFPRTVDGIDVLDGADQLRLIVRMTRGPSTELWFTWRVRPS